MTGFKAKKEQPMYLFAENAFGPYKPKPLIILELLGKRKNIHIHICLHEDDTVHVIF